MKAEALITRLSNLGDPRIAAHSRRFFKTGPGEYGEGDHFLGIRVPALRAEVKRHADTPLTEVLKLLRSPLHEVRLFALLLLVMQYERGDEKAKEAIFRRYLDNTRHINNWDLVDSSAPRILGAHLFSRERTLLHRLALSESLWERRIAVMATLHFIRRHDFGDTLALCEALLGDPEDLLHKATGWMLREIGKRDIGVERSFLDRHHRTMPRTMLRYAIEKFPPRERQRYLKARP